MEQVENENEEQVENENEEQPDNSEPEFEDENTIYVQVRPLIIFYLSLVCINVLLLLQKRGRRALLPVNDSEYEDVGPKLVRSHLRYKYYVHVLT